MRESQQQQTGKKAMKPIEKRLYKMMRMMNGRKRKTYTCTHSFFGLSNIKSICNTPSKTVSCTYGFDYIYKLVEDAGTMKKNA